MTAIVSGMLLAFVGVLMPTAAATTLRLQSVTADGGLTGYVLGPDGAPVAGGTVVVQASFLSATASIESTGHFRIIPRRPGVHELLVSVPGLAPHRALVTVPASRSLRIPVIRLDPGASFRVRLVSPDGEPIVAPRLRRRSFDASGKPIVDALGDAITERSDSDGTTTIGPLLPRSVMTIAVDTPFFAQTRLPDVNVGERPIVDGGTVTVQQPGSVLHVDVVDGSGAPVPYHGVFVDDPRPRSPVVIRPAQTNQQGRAIFDRLAAGRYRVTTAMIERCAGVLLMTTRIVPVPDNGTVEMPLVAGGRAKFRIMSPLGPIGAALVSAAPTGGPSPPFPFARRPTASGCRGATDASGRVTLTNFPPGPAHVDVHTSNSTYIRQIDVPLDQQELAIAIPDGLLPVRVLNQKNEPVAGATITWTSGGGRVEARATATGDALLEHVGAATGTLTVAARGYEPFAEPLGEPPGVLYTIALTPVPPPATVRARVMTATGEPLRDAVVELISADVPRLAATDAKGVVAFDDVPSGSFRVTVTADGFATSTILVGADAPGELLFTIAQGYRASVTVELPSAAGPQIVHVVNDANASMDEFLDSDSDRRVEPPGRLSLGPLAPGLYVIELQGVAGHRQERIRIVDRDVLVTVR